LIPLYHSRRPERRALPGCATGPLSAALV